MIEGLATLQETRHTTGGRGRSNMADMIKRMAVLEDEFPPLGNMDGFQADPPSGNLRYLFGQDFQQYIADRVGEKVWTKWLHAYGGGIPYWLPSKRVFGERLVPLYKDWRTYTRPSTASKPRSSGLRERPQRTESQTAKPPVWGRLGPPTGNSSSTRVPTQWTDQPSGFVRERRLSGP